ncbi:Gp15 family bacteriophage protein, partial [Oscillibacter sp.]|uniref:Gp15 family bacteriophage protein n=1 Tax=Oscillibacter sp. TaxID=1945593 RepID=UPI0028A02EC0
MNGWNLPESISVGGVAQTINGDFRDILNVIAWLGNIEEDEQTRVYVALSLFYEDFARIHEKDYPEAAQNLYWFINGGEADDSLHPQIKTIDWEQDRFIIVADINKVAGCEVRALPFCHWWTFL